MLAALTGRTEVLKWLLENTKNVADVLETTKNVPEVLDGGTAHTANQMVRFSRLKDLTCEEGTEAGRD